MIVTHGDVSIQRPIEEVFDFVADARNEPDWLPGATRVQKVTDGPISQGTRFEGDYARAGIVSLEPVEFERPSHVTFRARSRIVHFDDTVTLWAEGAGTRLQASMKAYPQGFMRVMEPVMGRFMRTQFESNWTR
jgi:carbon monoxide dehydrogenase subunit G